MNNPLEVANNKLYHIIDGVIFDIKHNGITEAEDVMPQVRAVLVELKSAIKEDRKDD